MIIGQYNGQLSLTIFLTKVNKCLIQQINEHFVYHFTKVHSRDLLLAEVLNKMVNGNEIIT